MPLYLLCESSLHAGSVNDLGDIDLPIQREKHTGFPKVESSSLKGALRQAFESKVGSTGFKKLDDKDVKLHRIFGLDSGDLKKDDKTALLNALKDSKRDNVDYSSAVGFADARLLLFPVRSMKGIFAWITCPSVLRKFKYELETICNTVSSPEWEIPEEKTITEPCDLKVRSGQIQLDEYLYDVETDENCTKLATWLKDNVFANAPDFWKNKIEKSLVVLPDDDFTNYVTYSTEVVTRIKINGQTGTVESGGLFSEEYLPSESVLYSLAMFSNEFRVENSLTSNQVSQFFIKHLPCHFQLGGNATLGKGIIRTNFNCKPKKAAEHERQN